MMKSTKAIENITLYLNTEVNCTFRFDNGVYTTDYVKYDAATPPNITDSFDIKRTNATKVYEYTFYISPIVISEYSIMKLVSIAHTSSNHGTDHGIKIITFRVNGLQYNPELYRGNDNGAPVIFSSSWTDNEPQYWNSTLGGLYLNPQTINRIVLQVSDDLTNPNAGIDPDLKWVLGLCIIPYDRRFSDTEN